MRSYYAHLETTNTNKQIAIAPRSVFRSSAIFPVIQKKGIYSRLLFMGYWILKRHIKEVASVCSLRTSEGSLIARNQLLIEDAKTFRIELSDLLQQAGYEPDSDFEGSLEIEFFSTQNLFFPYPAAVINYYGPEFSTVVHTAQRVYNDFDDMKKNSQTSVPESGFNIYTDEVREPFIGLINGCMPVENSKMKMTFINHAQHLLECEVDLGKLNPYETKWIYPSQHCNLQEFLEGDVGAVKIHFNVNWIFPRLLVGNLHKDIPALTITHTYYDCSQASQESDYWRPQEPGWHVASLMVPGAVAHDHFTNIYFYPIYSPSTFAVDLEVYRSDGTLIGKKADAAVIHAPEMEFHQIPVNTLCQELHLPSNEDYGIRLIARSLEGSKVPARIKIGLDIGTTEAFTPCNICTNLQPFNLALEGKTASFRWAPVLADQFASPLWLMNSSPAVDYQHTAELTLTFFRESDANTLTRTIQLPPHGFTVICPSKDPELKEFFQGQVGWVTIVSTNPYITSYYFAETPAGVVGGDHGF